uniref:Helicase C-terminal domain-containing protein n=1 Tax=Macrostomum lignano TaxID=282301 RepID=A0A1I8FAM9_9PLAT
GVNEALCDVIASLQWRAPTAIQVEAIPLACPPGCDRFGRTGSGQRRPHSRCPSFRLCWMARRTELCTGAHANKRAGHPQIQRAVSGLASRSEFAHNLFSRRPAQNRPAIVLSKRQHHVIIATARPPGRPPGRYQRLSICAGSASYATMTKKVKTATRQPSRSSQSGGQRQVQHSGQAVPILLFIPAKLKDHYLAYLLPQLSGSTIMQASRVALLLRALGFSAVPLHGQMAQNKRIAALNKFRARDRRGILVARTSLAEAWTFRRTLTNVLNFDLSRQHYVHRVGAAARAGRPGKSVTFVTQYDVERAIGKKLPLYEVNRDEVVRLAIR